MGLSENRSRLRRALQGDKCTPIPAVFDPFTARLAYEAGWEFCKINSSLLKAVNYGLPDEISGLGNFTDYAEVIRRIRRTAPDISIVVDADDCGGTPLTVARWVKELEAAGVAGIEIEDRGYVDDFTNEAAPRLYPVDVMVANLKSALAAREDPATVIIPRTTAFSEALLLGEDTPMQDALERVRACAEAGADALFLNGIPGRIRDDIEAIHQVTDIPLTVLRLTPELIQDEKFLAANHVRIRYVSQSTVFLPVTRLAFDIYKRLKEDKTGGVAVAVMTEMDSEWGAQKSVLGAQSWSLITTPRFRMVQSAVRLRTILAELDDHALQDRVRTAYWARVDEPHNADAERRMTALITELGRKFPAVAAGLAEATGVPGP